MRKGYGVREFHEINLNDLSDINYITENVPQSLSSKYINVDSVGRKKKRVAQKLTNAVLRKFFQLLIDHLFDLDRLVIRKKYSMYIGKLRKPHLVKKNKQHQHNFHTDGKWYGVVLDGLNHRYFFRMPRRRREELRKRIQEGEQYYG